jgi:hypothetical protein
MIDQAIDRFDSPEAIHSRSLVAAALLSRGAISLLPVSYMRRGGATTD